MKIWNLLCTDFRRAVFSGRFLLCVLGMAVLMLGAVAGMLKGTRSVWFLVGFSAQGSGMDTMIRMTLPVFAFGISYASEWEGRAHHYWMIRTGVRDYALSKVLNSALSGFLTVFVGMGLFTVLLLPFYPVYSAYCWDPYELLIENGHTILGFGLYLSHHGLSASVSAVCGMWFSTLVPNRYAAVAAPCVIHFLLMRLKSGLNLPHFLNPLYWNSDLYHGDTAAESILIKLGVSGMLCTVLGIGIYYNIRRRTLHE